MKRFHQILRQNTFWPLFGAMALGAFNDNYIRQALNTFLTFGGFDLTARAKTILGSLATGLIIVPFFLFSALAGELADRYPKSTLLKLYKAAELLIMILAAIFFYTKGIYPLLAILFFMGAQSAFYGPVKYSLLPEILPKEDLISGNGLVEGATFIMIVLGTVMGSYLVTKSLGPTVFLPVG
ncbi:MAG: hypothetical protein LBF22_11795, partial [Deltaproteobacteria bacterium]|nr:hypothetical protein [Deltaproteobacteria bacterium]